MIPSKAYHGDGALTNRAGARHGPREVCNATTLMRTTHHVTKVNPYQQARIADVGGIDFTEVFDIEKNPCSKFSLH